MVKQEWRDVICDWATSTPAVKTVHIVGSRAKNSAHSESDLDVAITLLEDSTYGEWFFRADRWKLELQSRLDVQLHLLRGTEALGNPTIANAIADHGILIFERTNQG